MKPATPAPKSCRFGLALVALILCGSIAYSCPLKFRIRTALDYSRCDVHSRTIVRDSRESDCPMIWSDSGQAAVKSSDSITAGDHYQHIQTQRHIYGAAVGLGIGILGGALLGAGTGRILADENNVEESTAYGALIGGVVGGIIGATYGAIHGAGDFQDSHR